jgi:hypothetical protein
MTSPRPVFIYSMTARGTAFKNFFEPGELKKIIENPGQLRPSGFDLATRDRARIIKGQYFEVSSAERKRIRVYQDGSVIARVSGDEDFLSWGQNTSNFDQSPRLNTIALIEFTLNFCRFCSQLIPFLEPKPQQVNLKVDIRHAFIGQEKLFLIPYTVSSWAFTTTDGRKDAPEESMVRMINADTDVLRLTPAYAAYKLVSQIFYWFGVEDEQIPYTSQSSTGERFVDQALIIHSRGS